MHTQVIHKNSAILNNRKLSIDLSYASHMFPERPMVSAADDEEEKFDALSTSIEGCATGICDVDNNYIRLGQSWEDNFAFCCFGTSYRGRRAMCTTEKPKSTYIQRFGVASHATRSLSWLVFIHQRLGLKRWHVGVKAYDVNLILIIGWCCDPCSTIMCHTTCQKRAVNAREVYLPL